MRGLNHVYRLIWSDVQQRYVAVAEVARSKGKSSPVVGCANKLRAVIFAPILMMLSPAQALNSNTLPAGGTVEYGEASINVTPNALTINQATNKAIIGWDAFDIGSAATVNVVQPSVDSALLNRVRSSDPSQIFGHLNANGQVFLINPNGVIFGQSARVDVGALVASTLDLSNDNFIAGSLNFKGPSTAQILNQGSLTGGLVALIAPDIKNDGDVVAHLGPVVFSGGNEVALTFADNALVSIAVEVSTLKSVIENSGSIVAENGLVLLKASAAQALVDQMINAPMGADNLISVNGVPQFIKSSGAIRANAIEIDAGVRGGVEVSGNLTVASSKGVAETISVTGKEVIVASTAKLDATGLLGGGEILIGGDWQGGGTLTQSVFATVESGSILDASALLDGDGGKVVVWSDVTNPDSVTEAHGAIYALGNGQGGGGRVETSGYILRVEDIDVDASAKNGKTGLWLLDPIVSTVAAAGGDITPSTIESSLDGGTSVTLQSTTGGNISIESAINTTANTGAALTLSADGTIYLSADITTSGAQIYDGAVVLSADTTLSTSDADVTFNSTINGLYDLTVNTGSGDITTGVIGSTTALYDLTLSSTGTINLGGNVTTFGAQNYNGNVELSGYTTLYSKGVDAIAATDYTDTSATGSVTFTDGGVVDFILYGGKGGTNGDGTAGSDGDIYSLALRLSGDTTATLSLGNTGSSGVKTSWWGTAAGGAGGANYFTDYNGSSGSDNPSADLFDLNNHSGGGGGAATIVRIGVDDLVAAGGNGRSGDSSGGAGGGISGSSGVKDVDSSLVYDELSVAAYSWAQSKITYSRSAIASSISFGGQVTANTHALTIQTDTLTSTANTQIVGSGAITVNAGAGASSVNVVNSGNLADQVPVISQFDSAVQLTAKSTFTVGDSVPGTLGVSSGSPQYAKPAASIEEYEIQVANYDVENAAYAVEQVKYNDAVKVHAQQLNAYEIQKTAYEAELQAFTVAQAAYVTEKRNYDQKFAQHQRAQQDYRNAVNRRNSWGWFKWMLPVPTPPAAFTLKEPVVPKPVATAKPVFPEAVAMKAPQPPSIPLPPQPKSEASDLPEGFDLGSGFVITASGYANNGDKEAGAGGSDENNNSISGELGNQGNDKLVGNAGGQKAKSTEQADTVGDVPKSLSKNEGQDVSASLVKRDDLILESMAKTNQTSSKSRAQDFTNEDVIQVKRPPSYEMAANQGSLLVYQFPENTFVHSNPEGRIAMEVRMKAEEGLTNLPDWLAFDPNLKQVKGMVPANPPKSILLRAIGRDQWGGEVFTDVEIQIR